MVNATAKNEIQVILQEYLGRRKAVEVAESVYAVRQTETQHTHNGKECLVYEDSNGAIMLTESSMAENCIIPILYRNLEIADVPECLEQLMAVCIFDLEEHSPANNATAKSKIHEVLQEHLEKRKAVEVAEHVYAVMQTETQHTHNGKKFFIHEDSNGALVLTRMSMAKKCVETILSQNLEKDEVQECLEQLMAGIISNEVDVTTDIETISVEGSDSHIYMDLLLENISDEPYSKKMHFLKDLQAVLKAGVKPFKVPVCDPSINKENGCLQFVAGCNPAVGYEYNELEKLAISHGMQIGTQKQYILFIATIIHCLIEEGWSKDSAFYAVLNDSTKLGHYRYSENAKNIFEPTGSRKIAGKCDLANTIKILAKDKENYVGYAGGTYDQNGADHPIYDVLHYKEYMYDYWRHENHDNSKSVGWFVL